MVFFYFLRKLCFFEVYWEKLLNVLFLYLVIGVLDFRSVFIFLEDIEYYFLLGKWSIRELVKIVLNSWLNYSLVE